MEMTAHPQHAAHLQEQPAAIEYSIAGADADVSGFALVSSVNFALRLISFGAETLGDQLARTYYTAAYGPNAPV